MLAYFDEHDSSLCWWKCPVDAWHSGDDGWADGSRQQRYYHWRDVSRFSAVCSRGQNTQATSRSLRPGPGDLSVQWLTFICAVTLFPSSLRCIACLCYPLFSLPWLSHNSWLTRHHSTSLSIFFLVSFVPLFLFPVFLSVTHHVFCRHYCECSIHLSSNLVLLMRNNGCSLLWCLWTVWTCCQAEMNALKKTQEDLQKGRQKLDDMLQRLEREQVGIGCTIGDSSHCWGMRP